MKKNTIVEIIASLFILLFVYTALSKLYDPERFKWALGKSPLLSDGASLIAWLLPAVELAVALMLFFPSTKQAGLYASLCLVSVFTLYIAYMVLVTPHSKLPCSCGGILQKMSWNQHLLFNLIFTSLASIAIILTKNSHRLSYIRKKQPNYI
jgi:hypothetical protein